MVRPSGFCARHCGLAKAGLELSKADEELFGESFLERMQANLFELFFRLAAYCWRPLLEWLTSRRFIYFVFKKCFEITLAESVDFSRLANVCVFKGIIANLILKEVARACADRSVFRLMRHDIPKSLFPFVEAVSPERGLPTDAEYEAFYKAHAKFVEDFKVRPQSGSVTGTKRYDRIGSFADTGPVAKKRGFFGKLFRKDKPRLVPQELSFANFYAFYVELFFPNLGCPDKPDAKDSAVCSVEAVFAYFLRKIQTHSQVVYILGRVLSAPVGSNSLVNPFWARFLCALTMQTYSFESSGPTSISPEPVRRALEDEYCLLDLLLHFDLAVQNAALAPEINQALIHINSDTELAALFTRVHAKQSYFFTRFAANDELSSVLDQRAKLCLTGEDAECVTSEGQAPVGHFRRLATRRILRESVSDLMRGHTGSEFEFDNQRVLLVNKLQVIESKPLEFYDKLSKVFDEVGSSHLESHFRDPGCFGAFADLLLSLDLVKVCVCPWDVLVPARVEYYRKPLILLIQAVSKSHRLFLTAMNSKRDFAKAYPRMLSQVFNCISKLRIIEEKSTRVSQVRELHGDYNDRDFLGTLFAHMLVQNLMLELTNRASPARPHSLRRLGVCMLEHEFLFVKISRLRVMRTVDDVNAIQNSVGRFREHQTSFVDRLKTSTIGSESRVWPEPGGGSGRLICRVDHDHRAASRDPHAHAQPRPHHADDLQGSVLQVGPATRPARADPPGRAGRARLLPERARF